MVGMAGRAMATESCREARLMSAIGAPSAAIRSAATGAFAGLLLALCCASATAQERSIELKIVADKVRSLGFECRNPSSVERIQAESMPDEPVYVLTCEGVSYRVQLVPDRAARVSQIM